MIQKVRKTVDILQVQLIDKVVEISEITQSKDKMPKTQKVRKFEEVHRQTVDVPVMLKRQCQPSAQVFDQVPTTGAHDAKMQKDANVSPQESEC